MKVSTKKNINKRIVVIGTSAGGLSALIELLRQLPDNFPSPILVVQHISADASGNVLLDSLNENTSLTCVRAQHGDYAEAGYIYLAPSDHHLMIAKNGKLLVTKGAQENRSRPAIDPLFRSAGVAYRNRATAVLLSGYLDDGTSGLIAVQRCGGSCIVQDPHDAEYPDMPQNALNQLNPDFCVPISEMGVILYRLASEAPGKLKPLPKDIQREYMIAQRVLSDLPSVNALGNQVPFNCPGCGGVLWKVENGESLRYRCHVGHAYTAASLLADQTQKIEETMWTALRMFEERRNLLTTISQEQTGAAASSAEERAKLSQVHIDRIRAFLLSDDKATRSDIPK